MNIDWSKAPEGYPLWIEDLHPERGGDESGWHNENLESPDGSYWDDCDEGSHFRIHRKPEPWNGEGLPPVGTVCEWKEKTGFQWVAATVLFISESSVVLQRSDGFEWQMLTKRTVFRPILTMQQIAAEAREKAIARMVLDLDVPTAIAARAYDAGYYKFEIVEEQP